MEMIANEEVLKVYKSHLSRFRNIFAVTKNTAPYYFVMPILIIFVVFMIYPIFDSIILSFK